MDVDYYPLKGNELRVYFTRNIRAMLEGSDVFKIADMVFGNASCFIHSEWRTWNSELRYGLDAQLGEMNTNKGVITPEVFLDFIMQVWEIAAEGWPDLGVGISYFNPTFKVNIKITAQAARLKPGQKPEDIEQLDPEKFPSKTKELELVSPPEGLLYPNKVREELGLPIPGAAA